MKTDEPQAPDSRARPVSTARTAAVCLQVAFVVLLLVLWFSSASIRQSKHLLVLFLYSFPANFLVSILPPEPALLFFSKYYSPLIVTAVAVAGALLVEFLNYSAFRYFADLRPSERISGSKWVRKLIDLFGRAPFAAMLVVGVLPVPFYPFRILAALCRYPVWKFLLAVLLSRVPRYYLVAWLGHALTVPNYILIIIFLALSLATYLPVVMRGAARRKGGPASIPAGGTDGPGRDSPVVVPPAEESARGNEIAARRC